MGMGMEVVMKAMEVVSLEESRNLKVMVAAMVTHLPRRRVMVAVMVMSMSPIGSHP